MKATSTIVTAGASPAGAAATKKVIRPAPAVSDRFPVKPETMSRKRNGCADGEAAFTPRPTPVRGPPRAAKTPHSPPSAPNPPRGPRRSSSPALARISS